ncbi:MAG: hypothetical protein IJ661_09725 [Lachnospiraceae bacterium]|nr:hypothetical protein [Lachnospiraceae bacterium]
MSGKLNIKTLLGIIVLVIVAGIIGLFGFRVVVTSAEIPGKLSSVSAAATNLNYVECSMKKVKKVSFDNMKYGYLDGQMLAQMDNLDKFYENERMEEVRAINNLTAMAEKTADKLAYERLKAQHEEEVESARKAAELAEQQRKAQVQALIDEYLRPLEENQNIDTGDSSDTGYGDTASRGGKKGKPVYSTTHGKSLGTFVITAYCTCKICCGIYSGRNRTASGTVPTTNRTIAVDTDVIPFGTKVVFNGQVYVAEDRGGAIVGKRIDLFFYTHKEATRWGRRSMEVFLAE